MVDLNVVTDATALQVDALAPWLREETDDPGPFTIRRLTGGNTNETMSVSSPSGSWVLRRPPARLVDASAHNVQREYRVMMALADTHVPVPRPVAISREPEPGGPPALLMEHIDGLTLSGTMPDLYHPTTPRRLGFAAVDALADLHSLPWQELGLADFGRPENFLERQVARWQSRYERYATRRIPDFRAVAAWLDKHRPEPREPGILHGDFHLSNCLFSNTNPPRLVAIVDWEMATIGDPLLDIGLLLGLWGTEREQPYAFPSIQAFSRLPSAPTRAELAARYERRSGRSLEHANYYMALALWKLAAVVEGIYAQHAAGLVSTDYSRRLKDDVPRLLAEAKAFTKRA
jgi:aminoglycoside phosphotransferase (APT) family kinase protein